jgi:hypothetical protein
MAPPADDTMPQVRPDSATYRRWDLSRVAGSTGARAGAWRAAALPLLSVRLSHLFYLGVGACTCRTEPVDFPRRWLACVRIGGCRVPVAGCGPVRWTRIAADTPPPPPPPPPPLRPLSFPLTPPPHTHTHAHPPGGSEVWVAVQAWQNGPQLAQAVVHSHPQCPHVLSRRDGASLVYLMLGSVGAWCGAGVGLARVLICRPWCLWRRLLYHPPFAAPSLCPCGSPHPARTRSPWGSFEWSS